MRKCQVFSCLVCLLVGFIPESQITINCHDIKVTNIQVLGTQATEVSEHTKSSTTSKLQQNLQMDNWELQQQRW